MIRNTLSISLLCVLSVSVAGAEPSMTSSSNALRNLLQERAENVFKLSDKDHDQRLNLDEQADGDLRIQTLLTHFAKQNVLGGKRVAPQVDEPVFSNLDRLTAEEFIQHFLAKAAEVDARERAHRLAKSQPPKVQVVAVPVFVPVAAKVTNIQSNSQPWMPNPWFFREMEHRHENPWQAQQPAQEFRHHEAHHWAATQMAGGGFVQQHESNHRNEKHESGGHSHRHGK